MVIVVAIGSSIFLLKDHVKPGAMRLVARTLGVPACGEWGQVWLCWHHLYEKPPTPWASASFFVGVHLLNAMLVAWACHLGVQPGALNRARTHNAMPNRRHIGAMHEQIHDKVGTISIDPG